MKQYIVAGNHAEFIAWKLRKTPMQVQNAVYVSSTDILRGVSDPHGLFIGSYKSRKDIGEIETIIKIAQMKPAQYTWNTPNPIVGVLAQEMSDAIDADVIKSLKQPLFMYSINGIMLSDKDYTYTNYQHQNQIVLNYPLGVNDTLEVRTERGAVFMFAGDGKSIQFSWSYIW